MISRRIKGAGRVFAFMITYLPSVIPPVFFKLFPEPYRFLVLLQVLILSLLAPELQIPHLRSNSSFKDYLVNLHHWFQLPCSIYFLLLQTNPLIIISFHIKCSLSNSWTHTSLPSSSAFKYSVSHHFQSPTHLLRFFPASGSATTLVIFHHVGQTDI